MEDLISVPHPDKAGHCPACNYLQTEYPIENIKPYLSHASDLVECANCGFTAEEQIWFQWDYSCFAAGITDNCD